MEITSFFTKFLLLNLCCNSINTSPSPLKSNAKTISKTKSQSRISREPPKYFSGKDVCTTPTKVVFCNLHTPSRLCICYTPEGFRYFNKSSQFCPKILQLHSLEYFVLTIAVALPVPGQFLMDPDSMFAEDLELFAGFKRTDVFILRKGCDDSQKFFEFQFAILKSTRQHKTTNLTQNDLQIIYPKMFTDNLNFMRQKGLVIGRVEQTAYLRPLIGFHDWIYKGEVNKRSIGKCDKEDPLDCYFYELVLLFVLGIYLSAELSKFAFFQLIHVVKYCRKRTLRNVKM